VRPVNQIVIEQLKILCKCESLRDLEDFARCHHGVLTDTLGIELKPPTTVSAFLYLYLQMDVASIWATIREWTLAQIPEALRILISWL